MIQTTKINICFTTLIFCLFGTTAFCQEYTLKGKVINQNNQPIEFLSVILLKDDSKFIQKQSTDSLGQFMIKSTTGNYSLIVGQVGIEYYRKQLQITQDTDLKEIEIKEPQVLQEITITATKKLIERKIDRLVFNVENSIVSNGTDALEVIKATPKINVTQSGIKIIGKSSIGILVNGKKIQLSGIDMENYLRSIRSESIKSIEVITVPPSKYDAEGNAGLLNIILKRKPLNNGLSGSTSFSYTQRKQISYSPSFNINYSKENFLLNIGLSHSTENKQPYNTSTFESINSYRRIQVERDDQLKGGAANISTQYKINEKNEIGLVYNVSFWNNKENIDNLFHYYNNNILDSLQISPSRNKTNYNFHSLSAFYDINLNDSGKSININANYLTKENKNNQNISNLTFNTTEQETLPTTTKANNITNTKAVVYYCVEISS